MQKIVLNEMELAHRWGVSPKTLQRWRTEGRGPKYFKLSKKVTYPLDEIFEFEYSALHDFTWKQAIDVTLSSHSQLLSAREVAAATQLPLYTLTHPRVREALGIPYIRVGKVIRFKMEEIIAWARRTSAEMKALGIESSSDPTTERRSLLQALNDLLL